MTPLTPYLTAAAIVAAVGAFAGVYAFGRHDGQAIEQNAQAKADKAVREATAEMQGKLNQMGAEHAEREQNRQQNVGKIYREVPIIVRDPVYINTCISYDGGVLLDRAADLANGVGVSPLAGDTPTAPESPAQP
jgi:hypothetical protein